MPTSGSKALVAGLALLLGVAGCDELNPEFDPDAGPLCSPGERRCSTAEGVPEVCQTGGVWIELLACWEGSGCSDGLCLPSVPFERCEHVTDCGTVGDECTVFVDPDQVTDLGTFCVAPPIPGGRPGGQVCSASSECASGWCFRSVCFEACGDASQCTNTGHECALLNVTVDGVREDALIHACVPPTE
jgi:hypothetical protein